MAVVLTGTEYIDLDAHGAALDIRQRPLAFYAELQWTAEGIMLAFSHGRGSGQEWALFTNIADDGRITGRWENDDPTLFQVFDTALTDYSDGNMHRVLVVARTSNDDLEIYVDGSSVDTEDLGANVDTRSINDLTRIGMDPDTDGFFFVGEISNCALWDVEISGTDAQDLTAGTIDPGDLTSGLQGWWPLASDANDASGNDRHGTAVNDPTFTESGTPEVTATIGLTLDVAPTASATHQAQASVPLTLDVAPTATATHQATASVPLTLDVAATAQAQHQVAAAVALTVGIAPQAATEYSATAAIPLTLALAALTVDPDAEDAESVVTAQGTHSLIATATGTHDLIVEAEGAL